MTNRKNKVVAVPTNFLLDTRLSFAAKGLLSMAFAIGGDAFPIDKLASYSNGDTDEVMGIMMELEEHGYMSVVCTLHLNKEGDTE